MVDNQHKQISGYRDINQEDIDVINSVKIAEDVLGQFYKEICLIDGIDKRWTSIARTHFEEGFSALVRSIVKPEQKF